MECLSLNRNFFMEEVLKYENRDQLYMFLISDFGAKKIEEHYDAQNFGNFYVVLSLANFLLRYINDRSFLTIEISKSIQPHSWIDLSMIRNFVYDKSKIIDSNEPRLDNKERITSLNSFLKKDFQLIMDWFNEGNYSDNRRTLDELLKQRFDKNFPGMRTV